MLEPAGSYRDRTWPLVAAARNLAALRPGSVPTRAAIWQREALGDGEPAIGDDRALFQGGDDVAVLLVAVERVGARQERSGRR